MKVRIVSEYGYNEALFGLGLSYGKTSDKVWFTSDSITAMELGRRAGKLAGLGKGHDKFLRMMIVTLDITAPLYWWKQFDTYKIGTTTQSESTMHTLMTTKLTPASFEGTHVWKSLCWVYNDIRRSGNFERLNILLPQSFLQRRIVQTNYAVLRNILEQRKGHKLSEWRIFCDAVLKGTCYPEFLS